MFRADRLLGVKWLAVMAALLFGAMYLRTALPRLFYPYDLDFIEDGMLMQSLRFARGEAVFLPPNANFVPHVYMPLYTWLGGVLFRLAGPGYVPLRLLSLAAALFTAALIGWIARRESGQGWLGLACAGLFLGGYRLTGFWYELVRVDMLFMALALAGLTLGVYRAGDRRGLLAAALLLALAFWTKQTGLLFAAGLGLYVLLTAGRRAWFFGLAFAAMAGLPFIWLSLATGGWFFYYIFDTAAAANPMEAGRVAHYMLLELFGRMAALSVMAVGVGLLAFRRAGLLDRPWLLGIALAALASGLGRASVGGNLNNLIPVYTLLCLAPALLAREGRAQPDLLPRWQTAFITGLILAQFGLGVYNPSRYIPTPAMRRSGDQLIARLAAAEGEVMVMTHPYYTWLAGKTPAAQITALWHGRQRGELPLPPDFVARIKQQHYAVIISDNSLFETEPELQQLLADYYLPGETLPPDQAPPTITGMVVQPRLVYYPKAGFEF